MQPNAAQLKVIFDNKAALFRELKKYVKPIEEFSKDAGLAELKQEEVHIFLEEHYFRKNTGLLPIIENLLELNGLLLSYERPIALGTGFLRNYDKMIKYVEDEQDFLTNYFKRTLLDVINYKGFKPYWDKSFSTYENFLKILRLDLSYFSLALQLYTKTTVHWIINLIHREEINEALEFVEGHSDNKILSDKEINFFRRYIMSIKAKDFEKAKEVLKEGKGLLEEDEIKLMLYSLNRIEENEIAKRIAQRAYSADREFESLPRRGRHQFEYSLNQKETTTSQLAEDLVKECETLDELKVVVEDFEAPLSLIKDIEEEDKKIEEILVGIKEVAPEVEKNPEVKKFKKSKLRRLKARFRLARRKYKRNKKEILDNGLQVLNEAINTRNKLFEFVKSKLSREEKELEALEQEVSSVIKKGEESFDLKPIKINRRKMWVVSKDEIYALLEKELSKVKQLREEISKIVSLFQFQIYRKKAGIQRKLIEYVRSIFKRLNTFKKSLQEYLTQVNLKRKTKMFLVSSMLIPLLVGISPSEVKSVFRLKSTEEILKQLQLDIKNPAVQKMLEASEFVDKLVEIINRTKYEELPDYIKELISDGVLDIAIFVGAEFEVQVPIEGEKIQVLPQNKLVLRIRYVDTIESAKKAFEESDVIHVESHSRYGLGWVLTGEGMGNPLRMQPSPIKIPKSELHGYKGRILKDLGNGYVIVQASDEDIKQIVPRKGYQLISMPGCNTGKYFLDVIKRLREGLPTTVIYATTAVYASAEKTEALLKGIAGGKMIEKIVEDLNAIEREIRKTRIEPLYSSEPYQTIVLNTEAGSYESKAYDKYNIPLSITFFYDIEI